MEVYITKYALTRGILKKEGVIDEERNFVRVNNSGFSGRDIHYLGKTAFTSKEEAIANAEQMRQRKIHSLSKQIEKLEQFRFCMEK